MSVKVKIYVLIILISIHPYQLLANTPEISDPHITFGLQGQHAGTSLGKELTIPGLNQGFIELPGGEVISLDALFPGQQGQVDTLTEPFGDNAALYQAGVTSQQQLGKANTTWGDAYRTMKQVSNRARPDLKDDPVWALTDRVQASPFSLSEVFEDCSSESMREPDIRLCDRVNLKSRQCELFHDYSVGIVEHVSGPLNIESCGDGCLTLWLGEVGNNYWRGRCSIFEQQMVVRVHNPDAITSVSLDYAKWDDYMQLWLGDEKVWSGPNARFPPETSGSCELGKSWEKTPGTIVTTPFKSLTEGDTLPIKLRVSVTGSGEGYARLTLRYDPSAIISQDDWFPQQCLDKLDIWSSQFDQVSVQCEDMPATEQGCASINGQRLCEEVFKTPPSPSVSPLCRKATVMADTTSMASQTRMACEQLEQQAGCGFISSSCAEQNDQGFCIRFTDRYDCSLSTSTGDCAVSGLFPGDFDGCKTTRQVQATSVEKHLSDIKICETPHPLTRCDIKRTVNVRPTRQQWTLNRQCIDQQLVSYRPVHAQTLINGGIALKIHQQENIDAVISQYPLQDNDWTTIIKLTGNRQPVEQTRPATDYIVYQCEFGRLSGDRCELMVDGGWISEPAIPVTEKRCLSGWEKINETTCMREIMACPEPARLVADLTFTGERLEQSLTHLSADDGVEQCMMSSDQFSSVVWRCNDEHPKPVGQYYIGAAELALLPALYPDEMNSPPHLQVLSTSDQRGDVCWHATATYNQAGALGGSEQSGSSWAQSNGSVVSVTGGKQADSCEPFRESTQCQYLDSQCTGGAAGHQGHCYLSSDRYDCGDSVVMNETIIEASTQCAGPVQCMGTECLAPHQYQSGNFGEAIALMNAAQFMTQDVTCTGQDGLSNVNCTVFGGDALECKKAIGGVVNCCDQPTGVSLGDYLTLLANISKLDQAMMSLSPQSAAYGSWQTLRQPVTQTWSTVKQPFVTAWDGLLGHVPGDGVIDSATAAAGQFTQTLVNESAAWVGQTFGGGAQSLLFTNAGGAVGADGVVTGGSFSLGGAAGAVLNTVMAAYMIYAITMLLIQIIWPCEEEAFELNAKNELKSCHYVGSYCHTDVLGVCVEKRQQYCCFSSPLSRIIQQQARPQLNKSWGTAKAPDCDGFSANDLAQINWSQVNFDEWLAILTVTGQLPQAGSLTAEKLTGNGSVFAVSGERPNVISRALKRLEELSPSSIQQTVIGELSGG